MFEYILPPLPEIKRPDHLKLSAYQKLSEYRPNIDPGSNDPISDTDDDFTLADLQRKSGKGTSQEDPTTPRSQWSSGSPKSPSS